MIEYTKLLVPIDGSELSDLAFDHAIALAKLTNATITNVHVLEPLKYTFNGELEVMDAIEVIESSSEKEARSLLDKYHKKGEKEGIEIKSLLIKGKAAHEIIRMSFDYDLIIMGTLGRNIFASIIIGSKTEKVARHARCPVMLVRNSKKDR